jgi:phytoene dehydrogenase-like protein
MDYLGLHIYNFDPRLAHERKTLLTLPMETSYAYWQASGEGSAAYLAKKEEILQTVIALLDRRYPGLAGKVEMADLATPLTYERFTGNWLGSTQGWMPTPQNVTTPMSHTVPGLKNFFLAGQWVEPGGGLPAAIRSACNVIRILCKRDHVLFTTSVQV